MIRRSPVRIQRLDYKILVEEDENLIPSLNHCYQPALEQGKQHPVATVSWLSGQDLYTVFGAGQLTKHMWGKR